MLFDLLVLNRLEDGLLLEIHNPAGVESVEDLSRVLGGLHEVTVLDLGQLVAVLLGEDEPLLGDEPRVGQVATVLRVRVVSDCVR